MLSVRVSLGQQMAEVHQLTINNVARTGAPTSQGEDYTIGHTFDVVIEVTDIDNCDLRWFEKASVSYKPATVVMIGSIPVVTDPGMPANKWTDMYKLEPTSPIFQPWKSALGTAGRQTITIRDIPGILKSKTPHRTIDFCIEVVPNVGDKRVATARQTLEFIGVNGQTAKYSFAVWINDAIRPRD
jgi:hypothetical protein